MAESDELREIVRALKAQGQGDDVIAQVVRRYDETHRDKGLSDLATSEFGGKLVDSAGRLLSNLGESAVSIGRFGKNLLWNDPEYSKANFQTAKELVKATPELVRQAGGFVGRQLKDPMGIPQRAFNAFYEDPLGVAGDVALIGTGGGAALKATKVPRLVNAGVRLGRAAELIDPVTGAAKAASGVLDKAANTGYRLSLRPSAEVAKEFDTTPRQIIETAKREGMTSLDDATRIAKERSAASDRMATKMVEEGHQGGSWGAHIESLDTGPLRDEATTASRRAKPKLEKELNKTVEELRGRHARPGTPAVPDVPASVVEAGAQPEAVRNAVRLYSELGPTARTLPDSVLGIDPKVRQRIEALGPQAHLAPPSMIASPEGVRTAAIPGRAEVPASFADLPLDELLTQTRGAQADAFDSARKGKGAAAQISRAQAKNFKEQIEQVAPALAAQRKGTQKYLGVEETFKDANARPGRFGQLVGGIVGSAAMGGNPAGAAAVQGALMAAESPRLGARIGQQAFKASQAAVNPELVMMARAMRAAGASDEDIERAILEATMRGQ